MQLSIHIYSQETALQSFKNSFIPHELEDRLKTLASELQSQEYLMSSIQEELSVCHQSADKRAQLSMKETDLLKKQEQFNELQVNAQPLFIQVLGQSFSPTTLEKDLLNAVK